MGNTKTVFAQQIPKKTTPPKKSEPKKLLPDLHHFASMVIQNDMLVLHQKTDRYFSSGLELQYHWRSNDETLLQLFPALEASTNFLGVKICSNVYTPSNITDPNPQNDRPYAGLLYASLQNISTNVEQQVRISSEYAFGVIGELSQQEKMQKYWHTVIRRPQPVGWGRQIKNDIIAEAFFQIEKQLFNFNNRIQIIGNLNGDVGTLANIFGAGATLRVGWLDNYWENPFRINDITARNKNLKLYLYFKPNGRLVIDNSLLQGGLISGESSPVTISKDDIKRLYFNAEYGYTATYGAFALTYSQQFRTAEFRNAKTMFWGSVTGTIAF